jgi:Rps23 Pro-64 3,4-dihydroxylase Tpa1-like proline 4-hydroxylase
VFTVPVDHAVEMVAPFADGLRLSLTGWLRADEPPGPIPGR